MEDATPAKPRDMRFGRRLRQLRVEAGFKSQEALARALGVSVFTISRYEQGTSKPSLDGLYTLAALLGVEAAELLPDAEAAA